MKLYRLIPCNHALILDWLFELGCDEWIEREDLFGEFVLSYDERLDLEEWLDSLVGSGFVLKFVEDGCVFYRGNHESMPGCFLDCFMKV